MSIDPSAEAQRIERLGIVFKDIDAELDRIAQDLRQLREKMQALRAEIEAVRL